jgi:hypothetical protein
VSDVAVAGLLNSELACEGLLVHAGVREGDMDPRAGLSEVRQRHRRPRSRAPGPEHGTRMSPRRQRRSVERRSGASTASH